MYNNGEPMVDPVSLQATKTQYTQWDENGFNIGAVKLLAKHMGTSYEEQVKRLKRWLTSNPNPNLLRDDPKPVPTDIPANVNYYEKREDHPF